MRKILIIASLALVVIVSVFLYNSGNLPGSISHSNIEIPVTYPEYLFPVYEGGYINSAIKGEENSVTVSFLSKDSKEEITAYYKELLTNAYQISKKDDGQEYMSMGMKDDYIYSISVGSTGGEEYNKEKYDTLTTIGVMPVQDELKKDMDEMSEKEKEIMLIWFKAINEMNK